MSYGLVDPAPVESLHGSFGGRKVVVFNEAVVEASALELKMCQCCVFIVVDVEKRKNKSSAVLRSVHVARPNWKLGPR